MICAIARPQHALLHSVTLRTTGSALTACATRGLASGSSARAAGAELGGSSGKPRRRVRWLPDDDKALSDFLPGYVRRPRRGSRLPPAALSVGAAAAPAGGAHAVGAGLTFALETRGCQMNVADSEVVRSLLVAAGYAEAPEWEEADVVLVNTCAIRERAEAKVWQFLHERRADDRRKGRGRRTYALLGCMAERLREAILEHPDRLVDVVAGPDAYRDLPLLIGAVARGDPGAVGYNVQLSVDETYSDVTPLRENVESRSAFVSIARSCPMSCSFCIVPHVRGPERSRPMDSILGEVRGLVDQGVKEITLLGQNVNSWRISDEQATGETNAPEIPLSKGFRLPGVCVPTASQRFPDLLRAVAAIDPEVRVRFTSPHPAHFPEDVLHVMRETPNICNSLHLPLQSGSTSVLDRMRRRHTADAYRDLVETVRDIIPGAMLSTDVIVGFCGETEVEHQETLQMFRDVLYDQAFMYAFSLRAKTEAAKTMEDDVPEDVKQRRLREVIDLFHSLAVEKNRRLIGTEHLVLVEQSRGRPPASWGPDTAVRTGRTDGNKRAIVRDIPVKADDVSSGAESLAAGDYVVVRIVDCTSLTLICEPIHRTSLVRYSERQAQADAGLLLASE